MFMSACSEYQVLPLRTTLYTHDMLDHDVDLVVGDEFS